MTDLAQALSELKSLPDQELQRELAQPTGAIPPFLILSEMHERKSTRLGAEASGPVQQPKSMASEYIGDISQYLPRQPPPQMDRLTPPQGMPSQGMPFPATGSPAGAGPPMGTGSGIQSLPPPPQGYARGGLASLVPGYLEGGIVNDPNQQYQSNADAYDWMQGIVEGNPYPDAQPLTPQTAGGPMSDAEIEQIVRQAGDVPGYAAGGVVSWEDIQNSISNIESRGSGGYRAVGPVTKGDRPWGRYQVMGNNVPSWSEQYYGQRLTPQQFLQNQEAQDAVFRGRFGSYINKYGMRGASQAWLGGPGSVGKLNVPDINGTTVGAYSDRFISGLSNPTAAAAAGTAGASSAVAGQAAATAAQMTAADPSATAEAAAGGNSAMGLMMLAQLMAPKQQAAPAMAMPVQPYEAPASTERHAELAQRSRYG